MNINKLIKNNFSDAKRKEIAISCQKAKLEVKIKKLIFSSTVSELKEMIS